MNQRFNVGDRVRIATTYPLAERHGLCGEVTDYRPEASSFPYQALIEGIGYRPFAADELESA